MAALPSCATRKNPSARPRGTRKKRRSATTISPKPSTIPSSGERAMKESVCTHLAPQTIPSHPALASAAPA